MPPRQDSKEMHSASGKWLISKEPQGGLDTVLKYPEVARQTMEGENWLGSVEDIIEVVLGGGRSHGFSP